MAYTKEELDKYGISLFNYDGKLGVGVKDGYGFTSGIYGGVGDVSQAAEYGYDPATLGGINDIGSLGINTSASKGLAAGTNASTLLSQLIANAQSSEQAQKETLAAQQAAAAYNATTPGASTMEQQNAPGTQLGEGGVGLAPGTGTIAPPSEADKAAALAKYGETLPNPPVAPQTTQSGTQTGQQTPQTPGGALGTAYSEGGYTNAAGVYENPQLSKSGQYYRVGTDIFTSSGQPVDEKTFKQLGLNFDLLPNGPQEAQGTLIDQQQQQKAKANALLAAHGITADENAFQVNPIKSFGDLYKSIITNLGLPDLKAQIDTVLKEQKGMLQELADKTADINEDPWLTEGVRVTRIRKLQERYEGKLGALNSSLQLMQSLYEEGAQEARFVATETLNAYNQERAFQQEQLEFAINRQDRIAMAEKELALDTQKFKFAQEQQAFENSLALKEYALDAFKSTQQTSGLTPAQINATVNSIANSFDNEPIVKGYNTVQEGFQTIQSIGVNTKSPADDIAFIYAFAKIMDPNSVVREGEYNTIQKYAQTWADNFGFSAQRIFSNTNFLTADAKQKMLNALQPKVNTITSQYNNLYSEYQRRIEEAKLGGYNSLTNYSQPFSSQNSIQQDLQDDIIGLSSQLSREQIISELSKDYSELTPQQIQQLVYKVLPDGWEKTGPVTFNQEGGGSINAIAEAIGKIESSGRYTAIGPATSSGNRAYGKYQIMDFNIPTWSKEVLGYSLTTQQFLNSPELQDQIAYAKMGQIYEKYGDPRQVASVWFSGRPMQGNTSADVTGTNVPEYIRRFTEALNSYA